MNKRSLVVMVFTSLILFVPPALYSLIFFFSNSPQRAVPNIIAFAALFFLASYIVYTYAVICWSSVRNLEKLRLEREFNINQIFGKRFLTYNLILSAVLCWVVYLFRQWGTSPRDSWAAPFFTDNHIFIVVSIFLGVVMVYCLVLFISFKFNRHIAVHFSVKFSIIVIAGTLTAGLYSVMGEKKYIVSYILFGILSVAAILPTFAFTMDSIRIRFRPLDMPDVKFHYLVKSLSEGGEISLRLVKLLGINGVDSIIKVKEIPFFAFWAIVDPRVESHYKHNPFLFYLWCIQSEVLSLPELISKREDVIRAKKAIESKLMPKAQESEIPEGKDYVREIMTKFTYDKRYKPSSLEFQNCKEELQTYFEKIYKPSLKSQEQIPIIQISDTKSDNFIVQAIKRKKKRR